MRSSDEYGRLYAALLSMAQQSNLQDVQTRWLALAQVTKDAHDGNRAEAASSRYPRALARARPLSRRS
jgi:hypothetical protein